jgi:glycosyltransferase involved in cell wall biosynthesis
MPEPRDVTVVIPAYNRETSIGRAIESILGGTVVPGEILVADDGSSDGTVAAVETFGDPVRVVTRENGGPAAARNTGVASARGTWITFLDSDDYYLPHKLESQLEAANAHPDHRVVISNGYILEGPNEETDRRDNFGYGRLSADAIRTAEVAELTPLYCADLAGYVEGLLFRKEVWTELGGMDEMIWGIEDLDFYMRLSLTEPVVLQPTPGYVKDYDFEVGARITTDHGCDPGFFAYYIRICQKALRDFPNAPEAARAALRGRVHDWAKPLLEYHIRAGDLVAARRVRRQALSAGADGKLQIMGLFMLPILGPLLHRLVRPAQGPLPKRSPRVTAALWEAGSV